MATGALAARSGIGSAMGIVPVEFARLAIKRSGLQRTLLDAVDRHHFRVVAGRKYLIGGLNVAVTQRGFDNA